MDDQTPPNFDPDEMVVIDLPVEFYLKGRSDPMYVLVALQVTPDVLEHKRGAEALTQLAMDMLMSKLNSRNELWVALPSKNGTHQIIVLDELQSFSISPPNMSTERYTAEMP